MKTINLIAAAGAHGILVFAPEAGVATTAQHETGPILQCYESGEVMIESPLPTPEAFRVLVGPVTQANWTLASGRRQILVTSLPCLYFITQPAPNEAGAQQE